MLHILCALPASVKRNKWLVGCEGEAQLLQSSICRSLSKHPKGMHVSPCSEFKVTSVEAGFLWCNEFFDILSHNNESKDGLEQCSCWPIPLSSICHDYRGNCPETYMALERERERCKRNPSQQYFMALTPSKASCKSSYPGSCSPWNSRFAHCHPGRNGSKSVVSDIDGKTRPDKMSHRNA